MTLRRPLLKFSPSELELELVVWALLFAVFGAQFLEMFSNGFEYAGGGFPAMVENGL